MLTKMLMSSGGGSFNPVTLWTNPSPTSDFDPSNTSQNPITLSQSIENFEYIKVTYRLSTSDSQEMSIICSINDLKKSLLDSTTHVLVLIGGYNVANEAYARYVGYVSNTSLRFTYAFRIYGSATSTSYLIPTKVEGLK